MVYEQAVRIQYDYIYTNVRLLLFMPSSRISLHFLFSAPVVDFSESVEGAGTKDVMDLLLLTQYFDMVRDVGAANHCKTTFVPSSGRGSADMRNALLQADK